MEQGADSHVICMLDVNHCLRHNLPLANTK
jgi:hypothetical protein